MSENDLSRQLQTLISKGYLKVDIFCSKIWCNEAKHEILPFLLLN